MVGDLPDTGRYWLTHARVSAALLDALPGGAQTDYENLVAVDIAIGDGRIDAVERAGTAPADAASLDLDGGQVWPCFHDLHTHLDKGHLWPRARNPDGSFMGALNAVIDDRAQVWSRAELERRIDFSLRCAHAYGTRAIRTHLDSMPPQNGVSFPLFAELRDAWAGRIELQAVNLVPLEFYADADAGRAMADGVAAHGGILGAVSYIEDDVGARLDALFGLARERDLDLDFHVDEGLDPAAQSLNAIARATLRHGYEGRVACGHCCAISIQPEPYVAETLGLCRDAGIAIISLPMCNMYLQDRTSGRTPRSRGVTLMHEFAAHDVQVTVASDNTRDPFYQYGDMDMLEVFREATRITHFDHPYGDWPRVVTAAPAAVMGQDAGTIGAGRPADLVLFDGRGFSELLSRPQHDRTVLRGGRAIDTALPDYRELDDLFEGASDERSGDRLRA